jgi:Zn-finger nucleic acid-binding protein/ribosomal protein L40E
VRLVACPACHAQYDVTNVDEPTFECRCGATVRNETLAAVDARVQRCSSCGAILADGAERCDYCSSAVERDDRALSLICPECFARNSEAAKFCKGCGVAFLPEPLPQEQEDPPSCPDCDEPMAVRGVGGVWVRECSKCNGLWVPGERLDRLVQRAVDAARERAARGAGSAPAGPRTVSRRFTYRNCPVCHQQMYRKNFGNRSGVIVDWCGAHGTWLDKDELEQIATFIAGGGLREAGPAAGLSSHGRMTYEQARALVMVQNELEQERRRAEERGSLWTPSRHHGSGVGLVLGLLDRLLK